MAWLKPAKKGVDDWEERLQRNDPTLTAIHVFKARKFGHEEVERICTALQDNLTLTELSSSGHAMAPDTAMRVAQLLSLNRGLQSLCVGDSDFGDKALQELVAGLQSNTTLQKLDLEHRSISAEGAKSLAEALGESSGLRRLLLSRNSINDAGAAALAPCLHRLEEVNLSDCGICAQGATALAVPVAAPSSRLRCLRLEQNDIGHEGAEAIASAAASSPCLEELYLGGCAIGDAGAQALAKAVALSPTLRLLDLSQCSLTCQGAQALAEPLKHNTSLRVLRLRGNRIQGDGATALAAALTANRHLEDLDLGLNQMGPEAAELVAGGTHLRKLSLFGSRLGDPGAQRIAAIMVAETLTGLLELELAGCNISKAGMHVLFDTLQTGVAPALEVLLVAANPAVEEPGFPMQVDMLQAMRPELDVAWTVRGAGAAMPGSNSDQSTETPISPRSMPHEQVPNTA